MHPGKQLAHAPIRIQGLRCAPYLVMAAHQALMEGFREFVGVDAAPVQIQRLLEMALPFQAARR